MFTKEVLDIKSECEGNEVYEEVLLYMRLAWVCVAGPFVFSSEMVNTAVGPVLNFMLQNTQ